MNERQAKACPFISIMDMDNKRKGGNIPAFLKQEYTQKEMIEEEKMGHLFKTILCIIAAAVLCPPVPAMAENAITASIPVSCSAEGSDEAFQYHLVYDPVPGQEILNEDLSLTDGTEGAFIVIFSEPGTYSYKVEQEAGTRTDTEYSRQVYNVKAFVSWDEEGGMECDIIAYLNGSNDKEGTLRFHNDIRNEGSITPTGKPGGPSPAVTQPPDGGATGTPVPGASKTSQGTSGSQGTQSRGQTIGEGSNGAVSTSKTTNTKTGDPSKTLLYAIAMTMAAAAIWATIITKRNMKGGRE